MAYSLLPCQYGFAMEVLAMLRKLKKWMFLGAAMLSFSGLALAATGFSFSIGTDNFYASVGNYDYFPYAYSNYGNGIPRINFYDAMGDYGSWNTLSPFGRVWRPYVTAGWRPYVQGHWTYTRYGPTWAGYEPWAWAAYHYGNWVWTQRFGWVWVPGYEWHPGRVTWSHGYNSIGWMPAPPHGYDYSRGYLDYRGGYNQFDYYDDDFGYYDDHYNNGYYDSRYNDLFYNPGYRNIVVNLWIFIDTRHFGYSNYGDCYLDHNFTRNLFDRRLVRISSRPLERTVLERVVRQRIREVPVREWEIQTDTRRVKVVVPEGEEQQIRQNANRVVKQVIAPAFVKERKSFKALDAKSTNLVNKLFRQENKRPEIRKHSSDEIVQESKRIERATEDRRQKIVREKSEQVHKIEQQRQTREPKKAPSFSERKPDNSNDQRGNDRRFESRNGSQPGSSDSQFDRGRSNQSVSKGSEKSRESQFEVKKSAPKRTEQEDRFRAPERRPESRSNESRRYEPERRPEQKGSDARRYEPPSRIETRPQPRIEERRPQPKVEERRPQQIETRRDRSDSKEKEHSKKNEVTKQKNDSKKKDKQDSKKDRH